MMSGDGYGTGGRSDVIGGLMNFLCDSISYIIPNSQSETKSIGCVEATVKEFNDKLMALDDADKKIIADTMMDIFIRDGMNAKEFITMLEKLDHCHGVELLSSQLNYEVSLPSAHSKAFLKKKIQCSFENLGSVYDSIGASMIDITDEEDYAKALISHMVLYRSMCNYEMALDKLNRRKVDVDDVYEDLIQASIALFRVCALALDRYSIDEMQLTYSKMLSGEPLFNFCGENGAVID
jgi:hypothetical protein